MTTRRHHHMLGLVGIRDGRPYIAEQMPASIEHEEPPAHDPARPHLHQCPHDPRHPLGTCPSPASGFDAAGNPIPPLLESLAELPEPVLNTPGSQNVRVYTEDHLRPRGAPIDPRWLRRRRN